MKKILLIQPPVCDFYQTPIRLRPTGVAYLKAIIKKYYPKAEVIIKDYHHGYGKTAIPVPKDLHYLKDIYQLKDESPFSTFCDYFHFGAGFKQIAKECHKLKPDLIGISSLFTPYADEVLLCAKAIKQKIKSPIFIGGHHASLDPYFFLNDSNIDFVIYGEGEKPVISLLRALSNNKSLSKVPNLGFKVDHKIYLNERQKNYPISKLPWPDYSDFSVNKYRSGKKSIMNIISSRGCPYHCSFCSIHNTFPYYSKRSAESVFKEISSWMEQGIKIINFEDDNLTFEKKWFKRLLNKIIEINPSKDLELTAMNGLSYHNLDKEILTLMKKAGFKALNLSLVSSQPSSHQKFSRPHKISNFEDVVKQAHSLSFFITSYQILGLPAETIEDNLKTLSFNTCLPVLIGASPYYNISNDNKYYILSRLTSLGKGQSPLSPKEIYTLFVTTRIINFLKSIKLEANAVNLYELLNKDFSSLRYQVGFEILKRLLSTRKLYAYSKSSYIHNQAFEENIFFKLKGRMKYIQTLENKKIYL